VGVDSTPSGREMCNQLGHRRRQCDVLWSWPVRATAEALLTVQGVHTMADQVLGNQDKILANQDKILANQGKIESNQHKLDKVLVNQEKILANQEKILAKK
jgi:hypothetical protein